MKKTHNGLSVSLKDGKYTAIPVSLNNKSHYWKPEFQHPLIANAPHSCPSVTVDSNANPTQADYKAVGELGYELLSKSSMISKTKLPKKELEKLQSELETIHRLADDPSVPTDRREFFKKFTLPHPKEMPEAWRVCGWFKKRVLLIWGIKGNSYSTFLPQTSVSRNWDDKIGRAHV